MVPLTLVICWTIGRGNCAWCFHSLVPQFNLTSHFSPLIIGSIFSLLFLRGIFPNGACGKFFDKHFPLRRASVSRQKGKQVFFLFFSFHLPHPLYPFPSNNKKLIFGCVPKIENFPVSLRGYVFFLSSFLVTGPETWQK
jgi:hypothetical protein